MSRVVLTATIIVKILSFFFLKDGLIYNIIMDQDEVTYRF